MAKAIINPSASGIYQIKCLANGCFYIGSAQHIHRRVTAHRSMLVRGAHTNPKLQAAWGKYGEDAFVFETLVLCDAENLLFYEQRLIDDLHAVRDGFNIALSASAFMTGRHHSEKAKVAISAAQRGKTYSNETRKKLSESHLLVAEKTAATSKAMWSSRTPEQVTEIFQKVAFSNTGQRRTPEVMEKFRQVALALWQTPEHKAKMKAASKTRRTPVFPEGWSELQRVRLKERWLNGDAKSTHAATHQGRKNTEETKAKMRASALARSVKKRAEMNIE